MTTWDEQEIRFERMLEAREMEYDDDDSRSD